MHDCVPPASSCASSPNTSNTHSPPTHLQHPANLHARPNTPAYTSIVSILSTLSTSPTLLTTTPPPTPSLYSRPSPSPRHAAQTDDDVWCISQALRANKSIRGLDLSDNDLTSQGANSVGAALAENEALGQLTLAGNAIGDAGVVGIARGLEANRQCGLVYLDLGATGMTVIGLEALVTALSSAACGARLEHLDLSRNALEWDAGALLGALFLTEEQHNRTRGGKADQGAGGAGLRTLLLQHNRFGDDGAKALA